MTMEKKRILILSAVAALLLCILAGGLVCFFTSHVFVSGKFYPKDAPMLNLRGRKVSLAEYDTLREKFPNCTIFWDVPFQNRRYPEDTEQITVTGLTREDIISIAHLPKLKTLHAAGCRDYGVIQEIQTRFPNLEVLYTVPVDGTEYPQDTTSLTISRLTDSEVELMDYLPRLTTVDASGCQDYDQLLALQLRRPEISVQYQLELLGESYPGDTTTLTLSNPDVAQLKAGLKYLPKVKSVALGQPTADAETLRDLMAAYPAVDFYWEKTFFGRTYSTADKEIDYSNISISSPNEVKQAMRYFPNAEKVVLSNCGMDNETMSAFRDEMRQEYKVVWTVYITRVPVRTDVTIFHSSGLHVCLVNEMSYDLKYLEDLVVLDIGHSYIKYIDWIAYMPELKYVILADNWLMDISPIVNCQKMIYLELFNNQHLKDITPVRECKALQDLCISQLYVDPMSVAGMDWLHWLQMDCVKVTQEQRRALQESMPNTHIEFDKDFSGGWRSLQNYFDMRDLMGLPYNHW